MLRCSIHRMLSAGLLLLLLLVGNTLAQGTAEDYLRADRIGSRARGKVSGLQFSGNWAPDGKRLAIGGGGSDGLHVDVIEVPGGDRRTVFGKAHLEALVAAGLLSTMSPRMSGSRFNAGGDLVVWLNDDGRQRFFVETDEDFVPLRATTPNPFAIPARAGGRSGNGRGETYVLFVNPTKHRVAVDWVDSSGSGHNYALLGPGEEHRQHTHAGHVWRLTVVDGDVLAHFETPLLGGVVVAPHQAYVAPLAPSVRRQDPVHPSLSFRENQVSWTDPASNESRTARAHRGRLEGPVLYSPSGAHALVRQVIDGDGRRVTLVESSPEGQVQPKEHHIHYPKPGDAIRVAWPMVLDLTSGKLHSIKGLENLNPWAFGHYGWSPDGSQLLFRLNERGHQRVAWWSIDIATMQAKILVSEDSETFVDYSNKGFCRYRKDSGDLLWMSERSGTNHLYRYDALTGALRNAVTSGNWVLRAVDRVEDGAVHFRAMGVYPDQDPYHVHYGRVNLDGSDLTWLTSGDGTHRIQMDPTGQFLIASYSRVDLPPVHELRRASDGMFITEVGRADASALIAAGLGLPVRFHAPGRDGETSIWGIIHKPSNFDATKTYPVIESIYAGPHGAHVPKSFRPYHGLQGLAELGFIVVQIDGMGTNWRSKAFHDVAWKNIKDAGFPDRIAWMKAAAKTRAWMDLSRVGIFGGSAGGQNAMRAVLDHHDFYRVAAADCGCHDNRMDKVWWNEAWMGYPVDASYAASSNVDDAHKLGAPLLLTVGELDRNVDPSSTMQVVDALVAADKDFELIVFPGGGHGVGSSTYGVRRRRDFFVRHLMGVEPRR
jgi:dipeptidyl-peptidase 4